MGDSIGMKWLANLLIVLSTACPAQTASGQIVKVDIAAGFGGYYRIGKCMPVKIHLENSGNDLTGKIEIRISRSSFVQSVSLPSPSRKTFSLYVVPEKYFHELEIRLFAKEKLLKNFSSEVQRISDDERLVIRSSTLKQSLLSTDGSSLPKYKEKAVYLNPEDFPESWNEYDAVNEVLLDVSDTTRLSELQRTALSRWTLLGGSVTLLNRDRIMTELQKKEESKSTRTALGLGSFGGLAGSKQDPVPDYQPSLLDLDEEIFKALRIRNPMPLAKVVWFLGIFLLLYYCAVVLCLRVPAGTSRRKLWSFVGIPAIAILFSFLSPGISIALNAGKMLVQQFSIIHIFPNSADTFTTNDVTLLFSRKAAGSSLRPLISPSYLLQNASDSDADMLSYDFKGKEGPSAIFRTDLWRTRTLSLAGFSNRGQFMVLRNAESTVLANRSSYGLSDCMLVRGGYRPLGDIPAGRELQLMAASAGSDSNSQPGRSYSSGILSKVVDVYQAESLGGMTGDCVICKMNGLIPSLENDDAGLSYKGSTIVIFHLGRRSAEEGRLDKK